MSDATERLNAALEGRYAIERELDRARNAGGAGLRRVLSAVLASTAIVAACDDQAPVGPESATRLAFSVHPTNADVNQAIFPAVQVEVRDASGALVTTATEAVTLSIGTNPGTGTLSGTKTVNAVGGVATFSDLSIDKAGTGYALAAMEPAAAREAFQEVIRYGERFALGNKEWQEDARAKLATLP